MQTQRVRVFLKSSDWDSYIKGKIQEEKEYSSVKKKVEMELMRVQVKEKQKFWHSLESRKK